MPYPRFIGSSVDPEKLALTVIGLLGFLVTGIVYFGTMIGAQVSPTDFQPFIDALAQLFKDVGLVISTAMTAYGAIRKVYVAIQNRKQQ